MSAVTGNMFELLYGGDFTNFRPKQLDAAGIAALGDNILYQNSANGAYGIKISGTAYEFATTADIADFATETFVTTAISDLETAIKDGVAVDGDTLAKLRALIAGLESSKAAAADVTQLQTDVANITTLLGSDDTTLDELQEIVDFIKANKATLDALSIANIAGLQAALDGKVAQTTYDAFVSSVASDISGIDGRVTTNETDIAALQAAVASFTASTVTYVEATVTGAGAAVTGGYEYTVSVPATKKIVSSFATADGKMFVGGEQTAPTTIKIFTVNPIGASQLKFQLGYVPQS